VNTPKLLDVKNLEVRFDIPEGTVHAVNGVTLSVTKGETLAIVGESGSGKSVTMLALLRLLAEPPARISNGTATFETADGTINLLEESQRRLRRVRGAEIGFVSQDPMSSLNPTVRISTQLIDVIRTHLGLSRRQARKRAIKLLERVGIPDAAGRADAYPHEFSGGMRQRVMIAVAVACDPQLVIADEPTTALDVTIQAQILELIKALQREFGMAVLMITHDLGVVSEMTDRMGVMYAGKIVEMSDWETIYRNPRHPYTIKLLESLPSRQKRGGSLQTISGRVPKATQYPHGCRFAERCPTVMEGCKTIPPPLFEIDKTHQTACHLYNPEPPFLNKYAPKTDTETKSTDMLLHPGDAQRKIGEPLVKIRNLRVHFPIVKGILKQTIGYVYAVDGVALTIHKGKTVALVGESGCGKTSLGKAILRLGVPVEGQLLYNDVDLAQSGRPELHTYRNQLQIIFQDPYSSLNPRMMVGDIIQEGMNTHGIGENDKARKNRVRELMVRVGLSPDMVDRYPHEFSGGQRQRIGIARCLAVEPEFIVCDEATSALDVSVQAQILNLLKELQNELSLTYLFITHNLSVVEYLADEVAVMYLGRIVERGATEEIFDSPKHPYTRALLSAVPQVHPDTGVEKIQLEGDVPSPIHPPMGCHFHPRCPQVMPQCRENYPDETTFTETHAGRCYLYQ
jgi:peptide/nickel transport system ATP-binding protein